MKVHYNEINGKLNVDIEDEGSLYRIVSPADCDSEGKYHIKSSDINVTGLQYGIAEINKELINTGGIVIDEGI